MTNLSKVSIIILSFNGGEVLEKCLESVYDGEGSECEIIVVDNASTDGSVELVKHRFPSARLFSNSRNLGYAAGNNIGIRKASGEYVVILNQDTVVTNHWISPLIAILESNPDVVFASPKILMFTNPEEVNTCGNIEHFTGLAFCRGLRAESLAYDQPITLNGVSGCAFAARKGTMEELGYFDPDFFAYLEDADLSWSALSMGYKIAFVPESVVLHRYLVGVSAWKYFLLERNRYALLIKHYQTRTIVALLPALFITEAISWGFAVRSSSKHVEEKVRSYAWLLGNLRRLSRKKMAFQARRRVKDSDLLALLNKSVPTGDIFASVLVDPFSESVLAVCNRLFRFFYELAKVLTE